MASKIRSDIVPNDIEDCVLSKRLYHNNNYHKVSEEEILDIQHDLLQWYNVEKRTNMPWRKPTDKSWDQETLAQRAYEATVIDYYNRWMSAFPTIRDLANADIEKVNTLWAGLGYYSRAKRLWEGARKIVDKFEGHLPNNAHDLQKEVPGVGRYTAGAIASIVFGERTPVVDGNVIRVFSRWRAIYGDPKKAKTVDLLWEIAASTVPEDRPGDFNQALMELGARICVPQSPNCSQCPIKKHCYAYNQLEVYKELSKNGFFEEKKRKRMDIDHECAICDEIQSDLAEGDYSVTRYPFKSEKKPPRDEESAVSIVELVGLEGAEPLYLISKRPDTGLLAGLWEFPSVDLASLDTSYSERSLETTSYLKTKYNIELQEPVRHDLGNVVHLFSHIRKVYHIEWVQFKAEEYIETEETKWVTMSELQKAPIPTGLKKAIKLFEKFKTTTNTKLTKKTTVKKTVRSAAINSFFTTKKK
ncbi:DNA glycosylase [Sporodiniella umbellata]|nr:DNA glycosylase [Sporodiniella umbellata]